MRDILCNEGEEGYGRFVPRYPTTVPGSRIRWAEPLVVEPRLAKIVGLVHRDPYMQHFKWNTCDIESYTAVVGEDLVDIRAHRKDEAVDKAWYEDLEKGFPIRKMPLTWLYIPMSDGERIVSIDRRHGQYISVHNRPQRMIADLVVSCPICYTRMHVQ